MISTKNKVLFLTNHRGGGIGDFGFTLQAHLTSRLPNLTVQETSITGQRAFRQSAGAAFHKGPLIANLGLTAWGRSGSRNFAGFSAVGVHRITGYPTKVIVHHAIELFNPSETGYHVTGMIRRGAHLALSQVKHSELTVFSPRLREILTHQYGARHVRLVPLPGERTRRLAHMGKLQKPKVVTAGYFAPYKGIDLFIDLANAMREQAEFVLIGRAHSGLTANEGFQRQVADWSARASSSGIRMPGFLTEAGLDSECNGPVVGVLPYTSVSGASASFQLFAERGVPVVASDLPEFQYLRQCGAGVVLAPPSLDSLQGEVEHLLNDPTLWNELAGKQEMFNEHYSWDSFVDGLLSG